MTLMTPPKTNSLMTSLKVLYEDTNFIAVNKPSGLPSVAHPKKPHQVTAESLVKFYPAHRLDNETSGILLFAKTPEALAATRELFKTHQVKKLYWAWVQNSPEHQKVLDALTLPFEISNPLARHPKSAKRVIALPLDPQHAKKLQYRGKAIPAKTILHDYTLESQTQDFAKLWPNSIRLSVEIVTGFTHQIRAHLKSIGLPLLGDSLYGREQNSSQQNLPRTSLSQARLALHAYQLNFTFQGKAICIQAPNI